ncbi:SDR family oxidoreductase [Microbispora rosea]|uniref:SDR family oxidoreductase n=1 Tax=Microbispora rosea TaxID=58117 RepID=UPI003676E065
MSIITFAVAGATGRLDRHVVDVLAERGHRVVPMSRATGVDITTGEGLAEAVTGVEVVIDVASWHSSEQEAATEFFRTSARNLHEAGRKAGVARIAMASIIGADKATAGFLAAKKVHEELLLSGPLPVRILRAAQFHEFVGQLLDWQQGRLHPGPAHPARGLPHRGRGARRPCPRPRRARRGNTDPRDRPPPQGDHAGGGTLSGVVFGQVVGIHRGLVLLERRLLACSGE